MKLNETELERYYDEIFVQNKIFEMDLYANLIGCGYLMMSGLRWGDIQIK